jgi:hypothetical protein
VISLGVTKQWSNEFANRRLARRGGRAVDCAGLENRKAERPREFESHPLRSLDYELFMQVDLKSITGRHNKCTEIRHCPLTRSTASFWLASPCVRGYNARRERDSPQMRRTLLAVGIALLVSLMSVPNIIVRHFDAYAWNRELYSWLPSYEPVQVPNSYYPIHMPNPFRQTVFLCVLAAVIVNIR